MNKQFYLTGIEKTTGKSFVSLSLVAMLSKQIETFHCFKPFSETNNSQVQLLEAITSTKISQLMSINSAIDMMQDYQDELVSTVLKISSKQTGINYFEGSDFESDNNLFEYEFNLRLAYQLNCDVILVASAKDRTLEHTLSLIITALNISKKNHAHVVAIIINRVTIADELKAKQLFAHYFPKLLVMVIPEFEQFATPSMADIAKQLNATIICGKNALSQRIKQVSVAAKTVSNFLQSRLERQGMLIITPSDRIDILLGTLLADQSANYPKIAGIVLTGGVPPEETILHIIEGLEQPFPVLLTEHSTYETATRIHSAKYYLTTDNTPELDLAITSVSPYISSFTQLLNETSANYHLNPAVFLYELMNKAQIVKRHIVLPEGYDIRILTAADYLLKRKIVSITLLGNKDKISLLAKRAQLDLSEAQIIDINHHEKKEYYAQQYFKLRQHKNINYPIAVERMTDPNYFAVMMVYCQDADGMVSGADHTTADTVRPALEIIKTRPDITRVSSVFIMCMSTRVLLYGDCAINPDPDSAMLAETALLAANMGHSLGISPRVALLSYSSGDSGKGESVDKVHQAMKLINQQNPEFIVEGPIQYDAAVDPDIAQKKLPSSKLKGDANILIFPDLNTGNNTYKAVQRESGALAIGPLLLGLNKPVNDLSRGCNVQDIINTILVTAIQVGDVDVHSDH